jgi:uncharacterized membrane protein (DUF106 family)
MNRIPRIFAVCLALVGAYALGALQPQARADGHSELVQVLKEIAQYQRASAEAERSQVDSMRELARTQERQMESMRELVRATERCKP